MEHQVGTFAQANLEGIAGALKRGGNTSATVLELPGLNHAFQTAKTGKELEYGLIDETFAPSALKLMSSWMQKIAR